MSTATLPDYESNAAYHADTSHVSHSMLEDFRRSIKGYRDRYITGTMPGGEPSPEMIIGSALHCLLLEPDSFDDQFAIVPKVDRRTKDGKSAWAAFLEQADGKALLDDDGMSRVREMAAAVQDDKAAAALLRAVDYAEESIRWTDHATGMQCKCRPDGLIAGDQPIVIDLKTSANPSPNAFARRALDLGYHRQAAHYRYGVAAKTDSVIEVDHVFIVVGNSAPFDCFCYRMDFDALDLGRRQNFADLSRLRDCMRSGNWRDPMADCISPLSLPGYAFTQKETNHDD